MSQEFRGPRDRDRRGDGGYTAVKSGLKLGEKVVSKGSFTLKTQMQKGEMGAGYNRKSNRL